jgi:hypothetical protein
MRDKEYVQQQAEVMPPLIEPDKWREVSDRFNTKWNFPMIVVHWMVCTGHLWCAHGRTVAVERESIPATEEAPAMMSFVVTVHVGVRRTVCFA